MNFSKIYILGDIHGNYSVITKFLSDKNDCLLIQVGDFGIGFTDEETEYQKLKSLNRELSRNSNYIKVIRGNHDDPDFFTGDFNKISRFINNVDLCNIELLKDYSVIEANGENYLMVGGSISIDRKSRILDKSYWLDEQFILDKEKLESLTNIDRIICHTSPSFCDPLQFNDLVYSYSITDANLLKELTKERMDMTELYSIVSKNNTIKSFHNGHFHSNYYFNHNGTDFICLDINTVVEI